MKRIGWIDVLKFLGIFAIYYWHLCEGEGRGYQFILWYHVPLFFFLSGCTQAMSCPVSFGEHVKKKTKTILLPFFFFALLSMLLVILYERCDLSLIMLMLKQIALGGIRNRIFAYSLWFLTCLYVMSLLFWFIRKLEKRVLILGVGVAFYVFAARFMPYKPNMVPLLPYNADCALYYLIYYCIGYCVFPKLQDFLAKERKKKAWILGAAGVICTAYAAGLFWGKDLLFFVEKIPVVRIFHPLFVAMLLIGANLLLAFLLQNRKLIQKLGTETLYLCGNEFIIKTLVAALCSFTGIGMEWRTPAVDLVYVFVLLCLVHFLFVPWQKKLFQKLSR